MGGHIHESCLRVRRGEPPVIDGDGRQVQDYIHVGDVARANLMAMESDLGGEGINIVAGQDTSQARIVELVLKAAGSTLQPEYRPYVVTRLPPVTKIGLAREKARRMLGWEPQVSIEEGVAAVLRWVDEQRAAAADTAAAARAQFGWMFAALTTGSQRAMSECMRAVIACAPPGEGNVAPTDFKVSCNSGDATTCCASRSR